MDLGVRLEGAFPTGRLRPAKGLGNEHINVRVALGSPEEIDNEVLELIRQAYTANL
jgi:hypothetical protein